MFSGLHRSADGGGLALEPSIEGQVAKRKNTRRVSAAGVGLNCNWKDEGGALCFMPRL